MALAIDIYTTTGRQRLWLNSQSILSFEQTMPEFVEDLSQDLYSLPIEIPINEINKRILGHPEILSIARKQRDIFWECDVLDNNLVVLPNVKISLMKVKSTFDYQGGNYQCSISGANSLFGSKVKYKMLNELPLMERIQFTIPSRLFANEVMQTPNHYLKEVLAFVPVHRNGYFDESRSDFDTETMPNNVVNHIVRIHRLSRWEFGAPKPFEPSEVATVGTTEYSNYRTIPFFYFKKVLQLLFAHFGYQLKGDFLQVPGIENILIDNNRSLEIYKFKQEDVNRKIDIQQHLPSISVADFLSNVCKAFNLKLTFTGTTAFLNIKQIDFSKVFNLTPYVINAFESNYQFDDLDYTINWSWSSEDEMVSSNIKSSIKARASFMNYQSALTATYSPSLTDGDIVYCEAENYYYIYKLQFNKLVYYAEGQQDVSNNEGSQTYEVGISPLLRWVTTTDVGVLADMQMVSASGVGSYWGFKNNLIESEFPLRLFMIDTQQVSGYSVPIPYATNMNQKLGLSYSLKEKGVYDVFFKKWHQSTRLAKVIEVSILTDRLNVWELEGRTVQLYNLTGILKKVTYDLGGNGVATLEIVVI